MERTLASFAASGAAPEERVRVARELARAVAHLHARGRVHGALSPERALVVGDGAVVLAPAPAGEAPLERAGFDAPEIVRGGRPTPRSDVFSLGALAWLALSGRPPFEAGEPLERLRRALFAEADPVRRSSPGVALEVEAAIAAALEKWPRRRVTAAQLADVLAAASGEVRSTEPAAVTSTGAPPAAVIPTPADAGTPTPAAISIRAATAIPTPSPTPTEAVTPTATETPAPASFPTPTPTTTTTTTPTAIPTPIPTTTPTPIPTAPPSPPPPFAPSVAPAERAPRPRPPTLRLATRCFRAAAPLAAVAVALARGVAHLFGALSPLQRAGVAAVPAVALALALLPESDALLEREIAASVQRGDLAAARRRLDVAAKRRPGNPMVEKLRGDVACARGDPAECIRRYRVALAERPALREDGTLRANARRLVHPGEACTTRRAAANLLGELRDPAALPALEEAHRSAGIFAYLCTGDSVERAIMATRAEK